jgi:type IV secretory pathway TraG/TraD family ATPase VirD4
MYFLARLLLMLTVLVGVYCLLITATYMWPASGWLLAILGIAYAAKRGKEGLTTLGSARWANERDLREAGMLGAKSGLIVGRLLGGRSK